MLMVDLSTRQRAILQALRKHPHTRSSLAARIRVAEAELISELVELKASRLIEEPMAFYGVQPRTGADVQPQLTGAGKELAARL
jgi:predicted transcriptional regulator